MIPYNDLVQTLVKWRLDRGLPVTTSARMQSQAGFGGQPQPPQMPSAEETVISQALPEVDAPGFDDDQTVIGAAVPEAEAPAEYNDEQTVISQAVEEAPEVAAVEGGAYFDDEATHMAPTPGQDLFDDDEATRMAPRPSDPPPFNPDERENRPTNPPPLFGDDEQTAMVTPHTAAEVPNFDDATAIVTPEQGETVITQAAREATVMDDGQAAPPLFDDERTSIVDQSMHAADIIDVDVDDDLVVESEDAAESDIEIDADDLVIDEN